MTSTQAELSRFEEKEKQLKQLREEQSEKERSLAETERLVADKPRVLKEQEEVSASQEAYRETAEAVSQINNLKALLDQSRKQKEGLVKKASKKERVKADLKTVREKEQQLPHLRTELAEKNSEYERLTGEIERLRGSMDTVRRSLAALESAGEEAAACPVCGTPLTKERLRETKQHLEDEVKVLGAMVKQLEPQSRKTGVERKAAEEKVSECEKAAARRDGLEEELREVGEAETQLAQVEEEIVKLGEQRGAYGEQCVRLVGYIPSKEQVEKKLLELKKRDEALRAALERVTKGEAQMEATRKRLEELNEQTSSLVKELTLAELLKAKAEKLRRRAGELEKTIEQLQSSLRHLEGRLGEARSTEKRLREDLEEIRVKEEELAKTREEIQGQTKRLQAYELLYGEVFHEKGFPLTLLRDFLQDVELFSQNYISRFLPDKSVRIEADEDGRVAIDVIDGAAVRELATYSGGETVLIGFAVRLGIARAIAERSVANAPSFLIIDEGFGPLSPEFRREVLRTLNELSRDYERIIVISHVDDVRESPFFTSQIHISKDDDGHCHLEIPKQ
jgi:exonuclease SbcC